MSHSERRGRFRRTSREQGGEQNLDFLGVAAPEPPVGFPSAIVVFNLEDTVQPTLHPRLFDITPVGGADASLPIAAPPRDQVQQAHVRENQSATVRPVGKQA